MENPLTEYFNSNKDNLIHKWIHYFDIYHQYFSRFVGTDCVVLEIGVDKGGSLQMWRNYFGPRARIYGLDVNPKCRIFEDKDIRVFIGSQGDREFLRDLKKKLPLVDILIDDGGHTMEQQITSFEEMFDHIRDGGIYICEDTHTSYWKEFGGGYGECGSFIEYSKKMIDYLHAWHIRDNALPVTKFTWNVNSLHYYDSMFIVEKDKRERPRDEKRGKAATGTNLQGIFSLLGFFRIKMKLLGISVLEHLNPEEFVDDSSNLKKLLKDRYDGRTWPDTGETMIGYKRLTNLENCIIDVLVNDVPGDLIETGVWKGGACIYMRAILKAFGVKDRYVWVADSFRGLPPPSAGKYPEDEGSVLHEFPELRISLEDVMENFRKYELLDDQVRFLEGWFRDTIPNAPVDRLSILRLDGDMYESTIDVLFYLYPKLSIGGYCIIDDWNALHSCKKAVEDYRRVYRIKDKIEKIDWTGVFWKKQTRVPHHTREEFDALLHG